MLTTTSHIALSFLFLAKKENLQPYVMNHFLHPILDPN